MDAKRIVVVRNVPLLTEGLVREEILLDHLVIQLIRVLKSKQRKITSLQTKSSKGSVVNMFSPKQNRATFIRVSLYMESQ